jgi:hypothetical protein
MFLGLGTFEEDHLPLSLQLADFDCHSIPPLILQPLESDGRNLISQDKPLFKNGLLQMATWLVKSEDWADHVNGWVSDLACGSFANFSARKTKAQ